MESRRKTMSQKRKAAYAARMKRATHMLFYKRHQQPGAKGWELRKTLGPDYHKVVELLDEFLNPLDLQVKTVFEEEKTPEKPTPEELDKARFYVTLKGEVQPRETKMIGWRIDDLAGLAISVSYIISKKGQAPRRELEELLGEKIPGWKVNFNLDKYIRYGYIQQDEKEQMYLDWRTRAEIDQKTLINLLLENPQDNTAATQVKQEENNCSDDTSE
jgi:hypothetical protein